MSFVYMLGPAVAMEYNVMSFLHKQLCKDFGLPRVRTGDGIEEPAKCCFSCWQTKHVLQLLTFWMWLILRWLSVNFLVTGVYEAGQIQRRPWGGVRFLPSFVPLGNFTVWGMLGLATSMQWVKKNLSKMQMVTVPWISPENLSWPSATLENL